MRGFQNTCIGKYPHNKADVRKEVHFLRKGAHFLSKTALFVTIVEKKKKGMKGISPGTTRSPLLLLAAHAPTRTRSTAIFDFCLHSFTRPLQSTNSQRNKGEHNVPKSLHLHFHRGVAYDLRNLWALLPHFAETPAFTLSFHPIEC